MADLRQAVPTLLAVPNMSEGRDPDTVQAIGEAFGPGLLDVHTDPDHHRAVFTLAGQAGALAQAVRRGIERAVELIDLTAHAGIHPRVGAIDVAPIVYLDDADRGAACAEALVLADMVGEELEIPVFLYGILAGGRTRAELRRGGPSALAERISRGELTPDFGPRELHGTAGAVLVAARPPLVAFNVELAAPATVQEARRIAARIREGGDQGLPGVRAIGLWLDARHRAQVSMNIEDHRRTKLAEVIQAIESEAEIAEAELVGLAPSEAFDGFPAGLQVRNKRTLEEALRANVQSAL